MGIQSLHISDPIRKAKILKEAGSLNQDRARAKSLNEINHLSRIYHLLEVSTGMVSSLEA